MLESYLSGCTLDDLRRTWTDFSSKTPSAADRIEAVDRALRGPVGPLLRKEMGRWIVEELVPLDALVSDSYAQWRAPVRDAMLFVVSNLSDARLAQKLVEQIELPANTPPETRLLQLIERVPGLQKLGQVMARNRRLRPSLRTALSKLENDIRDVSAEEISAVIRQELGPRLDALAVVVAPAILSEASVSAVVRFTWRNPDTGQSERGVFKVLKPHIPACFAEDMRLLQSLAHFFGSNYRHYGFEKNVLSDTFTKVRRLLQHEIDFLGEQTALLNAAEMYKGVADVRIPQLIPSLCSSRITAMSEERGTKVTSAGRRFPIGRRTRVAQQLVEALVAVPLLSRKPYTLFHADPHAGNLLYDSRRMELVLVDWALTEGLDLHQRRHLFLLFVMLGLRSKTGTCDSILALTQYPVRPGSWQARIIRDSVSQFVDEMTLLTLPNLTHPMRLLERLARKGIRFPASLIMFSKVLFTIDGILKDVAGSEIRFERSIVSGLLRQLLKRGTHLTLPLTQADWLTMPFHLLSYSARLLIKAEQTLLYQVFDTSRLPVQLLAEETP